RSRDGPRRSQAARDLAQGHHGARGSREELRREGPGVVEGGRRRRRRSARAPITWRVLGELRNHLGKKLALIPPGQWRFSWVTTFPMFEYDETAKRWFSAHHPFTAPVDWTLGGENPDLGKLASRAYDLVLNGWELGSGSVRIHRSDVQQRIFSILGIGPEEQQKKFGFLLEALSYGAPPHAGFAV